MKWTVVWQPVAEDQLTEIYNQSKNKLAVSRASNHIDKLLRMNPEIGESRGAMERIYFYPPLAVIFDVVPDDCKVIILNVHVPPMWDLQ